MKSTFKRMFVAILLAISSASVLAGAPEQKWSLRVAVKIAQQAHKLDGSYRGAADGRCHEEFLAVLKSDSYFVTYVDQLGRTGKLEYSSCAALTANEENLELFFSILTFYTADLQEKNTNIAPSLNYESMTYPLYNKLMSNCDPASHWTFFEHWMGVAKIQIIAFYENQIDWFVRQQPEEKKIDARQVLECSVDYLKRN